MEQAGAQRRGQRELRDTQRLAEPLRALRQHLHAGDSHDTRGPRGDACARDRADRLAALSGAGALRRREPAQPALARPTGPHASRRRAARSRLRCCSICAAPGLRREVDVLNGAVAAAGLERHVPTPVNAVYARVLNDIAHTPPLWAKYREQPGPARGRGRGRGKTRESVSARLERTTCQRYARP